MTQVETPSLLLKAEPTVDHYFESFNTGNFEATATLFAADGQLQAPFEEPITGVEAIAAYLQAEAEGMQAYPKAIELEPPNGGLRRVVVRGQVTAAVFKVNAAWIFDLNKNNQIQWVRVKLLASMQELLSLRSE